MEKKKIKFPSELRLDLVSKDWVVIATGRAKRPEMFKAKDRHKEKVDKSLCPFCKIDEHEAPTLVMAKGKKVEFKPGNKVPGNWSIVVVPNKYPAFSPYPDLHRVSENHLYQRMNAVGFHEVLVTRSHEKQMAVMSVDKVKEVFDAYQERYLSLMDKNFVNHISIFHNHGKEAGASIVHPHSQIITTPLIDSDLEKALSNSKKYLKTHKKCIYCAMNNWERKTKSRIVFENKDFLVICPFASKAAFQVIISPKKHLSNFERITETQKEYLAEAFRTALNKLYKGLGNPAYNFYLHTSPCDGKKYDHYHWHWTIVPKTSIMAGFEIGTRMEISTIEPEKAAEYLRKQV